MYLYPVSYTHLDVYKRQALKNLEKTLTESEQKLTLLHQELRTSKEEFEKPFPYEDELNEMCIRDRLGEMES